jgi:hypothetical protein
MKSGVSNITRAYLMTALKRDREYTSSIVTGQLNSPVGNWGLFHVYALPRPCAALRRRRMKTLLQRLFLVVLMLAVFTVTIVVTVYLLGLSPSPIP